MKAILIERTGGPEVMSLTEVPTPQPKPNEALVKVSASGVNFIDVYQREGRYKIGVPFIAGQEGSGVVAATDAGPNSPGIGERVCWTGVQGSYAEYVAVPHDRLVPIPAGVTDLEGAAAMLQGMTAHYLSHDAYALKRGETALIHAAAGGVGLLLVQMAHDLGARVIGTVSTGEKAKLALAAGAGDVIVYSEVDFEEETRRLTEGKGVHVVYDGVGKETFGKGLNLLRRRGCMVLFGGASGPVPPLDPMVLSVKGSLFLTRPSLVDYIATPEELKARAEAVMAVIAAGKLKLRIGHTYRLAEAAQAHRELEARKTTGKLLLTS